MIIYNIYLINIFDGSWHWKSHHHLQTIHPTLILFQNHQAELCTTSVAVPELSLGFQIWGSWCNRQSISLSVLISEIPNSRGAKGQLISKAIFVFLTSSKKQTKMIWLDLLYHNYDITSQIIFVRFFGRS